MKPLPSWAYAIMLYYSLLAFWMPVYWLWSEQPFAEGYPEPSWWQYALITFVAVFSALMTYAVITFEAWVKRDSKPKASDPYEDLAREIELAAIAKKYPNIARQLQGATPAPPPSSPAAPPG